MPRVALHPSDKRTLRFPVCLSASEAELLDQAAAVSLDSRAEFIRVAAKEKARRVLGRKGRGYGRSGTEVRGVRG